LRTLAAAGRGPLGSARTPGRVQTASLTARAAALPPVQRRVRSWALGSRRRLAAPAVWDAGCRRYFAALEATGAGGAGGAASLVAFADECGSTLDALPPVASLRDGAFALVAATPPQPPRRAAAADMAVDADPGAGGVLVVSSTGAVRLLGPDGAERAALSPGDGAFAQAAASGVDRDAHGAAVQCVAVVSALRAPAGGVSHRMDVYAVASGSVALTATATLAPPAGLARPRVVALSCSGRAGAEVLWSDGTWQALAGDGTALATRHTRKLACFDTTAAAPPPTPVGQKKRRGGDGDDAAALAAGVPRFGAAVFGGGYVAVLGARAGGGGATLAVLDARYGGAHHGSPLAGAADAARAHCLALPGGAGVTRLVCATAGAVLLAHVHAQPLSLAAAVGALTSAAARDAFVSDDAAAPPSGALMAPIWQKHAAEPAASDAVALPLEADAAWDTRAMADRDAEHGAAAQRLLDAGATPTAASVTAALLKLFAETSGGKAVAVSPRVVQAAVQRCLRDRLWEPLRLLLEGGHLPLAPSHTALVAGLLEAEQPRLLRTFLSHAAEVTAADLSAALGAALVAAAAPPAQLPAAAQESSAALRADALAAVDRADEALRASGDDVAALLSAARLLVAATEQFSAGDAALLHAVVAARRDDGAAIEAVRGLEPPQVARLLAYVQRWMRLYHTTLARDGLTRVAGVPDLQQVVSWASLLLDGHFLRLAAGAAGATTVRKLAAAVRTHVASVASLAPLDGPVQHLRAGKLLPPPVGTVSAHYSVELLHL